MYIYPNLYTTVQNAMPMLSGNKNLKLLMNFNEYYPTSTKYLGIFQGRGGGLKEELKPVEVCASKLQILLLQQCCLFEKCKIDTFSFLYFFSLSFWHVIHSACSMYMLKMKTILYGKKTTTCLYKATKMIMSNLILIQCKNLN